jgi:hypothetical protein
MISLLTLPFRLVFGSVRLGWRTGRLVGPSRALFFGVGVGVGVLAASPSARRVAVKVAARGVATAKAASNEPPATEPTVGVATTD